MLGYYLFFISGLLIGPVFRELSLTGQFIICVVVCGFALGAGVASR